LFDVPVGYVIEVEHGTSFLMPPRKRQPGKVEMIVRDIKQRRESTADRLNRTVWIVESRRCRTIRRVAIQEFN
jgi:hypothetical protein